MLAGKSMGRFLPWYHSHSLSRAPARGWLCGFVSHKYKLPEPTTIAKPAQARVPVLLEALLCRGWRSGRAFILAGLADPSLLLRLDEEKQAEN